jgi:hypothetical protein
MGRVAICFFGLVKDLKHTQASLTEHIFQPLKAQGYTCEIFAHTYEIERYSNSRNSEANLPIKPRSIEGLRSSDRKTTVVYDKPEEVDKLYPLDSYLRNGDPWPDNPRQSLKYFLRQIHSLDRVTALWKKRASEFDLAVYLRPDTSFYNHLTLIPNLTLTQIVTPGFHLWGGYNDRFAYGRPGTMIKYGERGRFLNQYMTSTKQKPHAETYLKWYCTNQGLQNSLSPIRFTRIRANGQVVDPLNRIQ